MARPRTVSDDEVRDATIAAIGKYGPAKLTLARVAEEAGVTPAALVQRYGSKAALLATVGEGGVAQAESVFAEAAARTSAPLDALVEALAAFASDIRTRTELANHLAMLQTDLTDPDLHTRAVAQARTVRGRIRALLDAAVAAGDLATDDTDELALTVYTAYSGALITWAIDGRGALARWIRARVTAVLDPYH